MFAVDCAVSRTVISPFDVQLNDLSDLILNWRKRIFCV